MSIPNEGQPTQAAIELRKQWLEEMNARPPDSWWERHPAYPDLVDIFKGSTRSPNHLAFLALAGLAAKGWDIDRREDTSNDV